MILVRDIFQLKFGKAREAMDLLKKQIANMVAERGFGPSRFLTDLTGPYYTLIMETVYNDLGEFEQSIHKMFKSEDWKKGYQQFAEMVESGRREIFTIVPVEQVGRQQQREEVTAQAGKSK